MFYRLRWTNPKTGESGLHGSLVSKQYAKDWIARHKADGLKWDMIPVKER